MTPRVQMACVDATDPVSEVIELSGATGFSKFPVVKGSADNVVGSVHVKQAVAVPRSERHETLVREVMVDATVVPESLRLDPLLSLLRGEGFQMAIVSDEYGGTAGVVTLEDVVEEIVGDIADEHDRHGARLRQRPDGSWIVSGLLRPDEVADATGLVLPEDEDYDTVAGPAGARAGPDPGPRRPGGGAPPRGDPGGRRRGARARARAHAGGADGRPPRRPDLAAQAGGRLVSTTAALWLALVLLLGNAYFVCAEFALVSARRTKVEPKAAAGSRVARTTLRAMEQLSLMIAAAQFGITVCSLGLGAVAEPAVAHLIEPLAELVHLPGSWVHPLSFAIALSFVVYLHVVLGEMVPKNLALAGPERAAMVLGPPMVAMVTVLKPIVRGLDAVANGVVRLLRIEPLTEVASAFTLKEVEAMVDESRDEGMLDQSEYERLSGALGFTSRTVAEVLLPLDRVETVDRRARAYDVELRCAETGYSRFPVVGADGSLTGYLHIKDVLQADPHGRARVVDEKWVRPLASVRVTDTLVNALQILQAKGAHMARVVDDEGTLLGVATLEDVIEELVGEIRDAAHADGH